MSSLFFRSALLAGSLGVIAGALLCCADGIVPTAASAPPEPRTAIEQASIPDFELPDSYGTLHSSETLRRNHALVVYVFLGCDCPLARLYVQTLNELALEFRERGVPLVGINSNVQDSPTAITRFVEIEKVQFPLLKDAGNRVADLFGAERTPEAFLVDSRGRIVYRGRIDDQFGIGYRLASPRERNLADALFRTLEDKPLKSSRSEAVGCLIGRAKKVSPSGNVTYCNQIARILQRRCMECHREGEIGPFSLTTYDQAYGWAEMIREVVLDQRMPPWFAAGELGHFKNDSRLRPEEKRDLLAWIEHGCPKGEEQDLPPPAEFLTGWSIPQPDVIYAIADAPVKVPAHGPYDYQTFFIETNFDEDKWIVAAESRPGNRRVVHHTAIWILRDGMPRDDYSTSPSVAFAPGMPALAYPPGSALLLPKGAVLRYQIHYEPCGYETEDLSTLGLVFCSPAEVKSQILIDAVFPNDPIHIPPGSPATKIAGRYYFARDALVFGLMPHMHVRGKSFRFTLRQPDGGRSILLDIPHWDFGWQFWYLLPEPMLVPRGSVLESEAVFDNSLENLANPDANLAVTWGPRTSDEMSVGIFAAIDPSSETENPAEYRLPREGFSCPKDTYWDLKVQGDAEARWTENSTLYGTQKIQIDNPGSNPWRIQFHRAVPPVSKGASYCLCFRVRASQDRLIQFGVNQRNKPWDNVGLFKTEAVGPDPKYLRFEFYATHDEEEVELRFDLGAHAGDVEIEDAVLLQGFHR